MVAYTRQPAARVSVPSGGSWWEQHLDSYAQSQNYIRFSTLWWVVVGATLGHELSTAGNRRFSTLWWVVVGATTVSVIQYARESLFQYPLVGRGGSNIRCEMITAVNRSVSVPSGGSWWEQPPYVTAAWPGNRVSVPSGGSWWEQLYPPALRWRGENRFSTLWWVVVGATPPAGTEPAPEIGFSTLWWVVVGATIGLVLFEGGMIYVSVPSGGSWWEQPIRPRRTVGRGRGFSTLWWVVVGATSNRGRQSDRDRRFQYPLVGRGGSNRSGRTAPYATFPSFSTLWWVVVGATRSMIPYHLSSHSFSTLWWVVVGATRALHPQKQV